MDFLVNVFENHITLGNIIIIVGGVLGIGKLLQQFKQSKNDIREIKEWQNKRPAPNELLTNLEHIKICDQRQKESIELNKQTNKEQMDNFAKFFEERVENKILKEIRAINGGKK